MIDEAAYALVPGPVATTALATLLLDDEQVLGELMSGEHSAGFALGGVAGWQLHAYTSDQQAEAVSWPLPPSPIN